VPASDLLSAYAVFAGLPSILCYNATHVNCLRTSTRCVGFLVSTWRGEGVEDQAPLVARRSCRCRMQIYTWMKMHWARMYTDVLLRQFVSVRACACVHMRLCGCARVRLRACVSFSAHLHESALHALRRGPTACLGGAEPR